MTAIRTYLPMPSLRGMVAFFWTATPTASETAKQIVRLMPDGKPGMILQHHNGQAVYKNLSGSLPVLFVYGQATAPCLNFSDMPAKILGVTFEPLALRKLFGVSASEFTNNAFDLQLIDRSIENRLLNLSTDAKKIQLLSRYFLSKLRVLSTKEKLIENSAYGIEMTLGKNQVNSLHKIYGFSERNFERTFKDVIGLTPYQYSRIIRFQHAVRVLQAGKRESHARLSYELGYSDQSHYIRDFKEFSGLTPGNYELNVKEVIEHLPRSTPLSEKQGILPVRMISHRQL